MGQWGEVRHAFRQALRRPALTAASALLLAFGLGANATAFSLLNRVLWSPPKHVREPSRLFKLEFRYQRADGVEYPSNEVTYPLAEYLAQHLAEGIGAALEAHRRTGHGRGGSSEEVTAVLVSPNYLPVLGASPAQGPGFDGDSPGRQVLLSHGFWRRRYGGEPSVIGTTCWIANQPYLIVGVMPPGFQGLGHQPVDVWLPIESAANDVWPFPYPENILSYTHSKWVEVVARPSAGVSRLQLSERAFALVSSEDSRQLSDRPVTGARAVSVMQDRAASFPFSDLAIWGSAISFLALLAACANVANLMLFGKLHRRNEIALRLQLGACTRHLIRHHVLESLPVMVSAAAMTLLLMTATSPFFSRLLLGDRLSVGQLVDWRVLVFLLLAIVFATVIVGMLPIVELRRTQLFELLRVNPGQAGAHGGTLARLLVVGQVTLAAIVLVVAGAFWKSFLSASSTSLGFDPHHSLVVEVPGLERLGYPETRVRAVFDELSRVARGLPGVRSVSLTSSVPWQTFQVIGVGAAPGSGHRQLGAYLQGVTEHYMSDLGIELKAGREFDETDSNSSQPLAIVSESLASTLWSSSNPLGMCLYLGRADVCHRVIGVVRDTAVSSRFDEVEPQLYVPLRQGVSPAPGSPPLLPQALVLRTDGSSEVRTLLQQTLRDSSSLPHLRIHTPQGLLAPQFRTWNRGKWLFTALGAVLLVILVTGSYAQLSFWAGHRRLEIGVRLALGASRTSILRLLLRQALVIAGWGVLAGLLVSLALVRSLRSLLYGVAAADPAVLASMLIALGGAVLLSLLISSRRIVFRPRAIADLLRHE